MKTPFLLSKISNLCSYYKSKFYFRQLLFSVLFIFGFFSANITAKNIIVQPTYSLKDKRSPYNTAAKIEAKTDSVVNMIAALDGFVYFCPIDCNTKYIAVQNIPKSKKYFIADGVKRGKAAFLI